MQEVPYRRPPPEVSSNYNTRSKVTEFRAPFFRKRFEQLTEVIDAWSLLQHANDSDSEGEGIKLHREFEAAPIPAALRDAYEPTVI